MNRGYSPEVVPHAVREVPLDALTPPPWPETPVQATEKTGFEKVLEKISGVPGLGFFAKMILGIMADFRDSAAKTKSLLAQLGPDSKEMQKVVAKVMSAIPYQERGAAFEKLTSLIKHEEDRGAAIFHDLSKIGKDQIVQEIANEKVGVKKDIQAILDLRGLPKVAGEKRVNSKSCQPNTT